MRDSKILQNIKLLTNDFQSDFILSALQIASICIGVYLYTHTFILFFFCHAHIIIIYYYTLTLYILNWICLVCNINIVYSKKKSAIILGTKELYLY